VVLNLILTALALLGLALTLWLLEKEKWVRVGCGKDGA
jgi:hypothetical protein